MAGNWKYWDKVHELPDQKKRFETAKKAQCTPVSIDKEEETGVFHGSSGAYETTLDSCTCVDFSMRHKPCKHMYRLAIECGYMGDVPIKTDAKAIPKPGVGTKQQRKQDFEKSIEMLESYDIETQDAIRQIIYCLNVKQPYFCENIKELEKPLSEGYLKAVRNAVEIITFCRQKRTLAAVEAAGFTFPSEIKKTQKARYEWCLSNANTICDIAFPNAAFIYPAEKLDAARKKTYTYLLRKFTDDPYVGADGYMFYIPHGADFVGKFRFFKGEKVQIEFPDDDVTEMLNRYGANRCLNFTIDEADKEEKYEV